MFTYLLFPVGLALLIKGADFLVDGASAVARRLGVSALVVGLTVVAFGTSAPELAVNLFASFEENSGIAIGNVLGSNIANIFLILGVCALIRPLAVKKSTVWKEIPFGFLAVVMVAVAAGDALLDGALSRVISRSDGFTFLAFFAIFLYYVFEISRSGAVSDVSTGSAGLVTGGVVKKEAEKKISLPRSILMILSGLAGLIFGGKWVVSAAVAIASAFGVDETVIGLTVVAVGTSLPELATSAVAVWKGNVDIAVGNVVGSNIFNVFWILGISAVVLPLPFSSDLWRDILVNLLASGLLFVFMFWGKRHLLERWQGAAFLVLYAGYITLLVL